MKAYEINNCACLYCPARANLEKCLVSVCIDHSSWIDNYERDKELEESGLSYQLSKDL